MKTRRLRAMPTRTPDLPETRRVACPHCQWHRDYTLLARGAGSVALDLPCAKCGRWMVLVVSYGPDGLEVRTVRRRDRREIGAALATALPTAA